MNCAVTPAYAEPVPGWVDSLNGPIGVMIAAGKGVLRSILCDGNLKAEIIPVDFTIAGLILMPYTLAQMKTKYVIRECYKAYRSVNKC